MTAKVANGQARPDSLTRMATGLDFNAPFDWLRTTSIYGPWADLGYVE